MRKREEVKPFIDLQEACVNSLDGLTVGDPYTASVIRGALARAFVAGVRSGRTCAYLTTEGLAKVLGVEPEQL